MMRWLWSVVFVVLVALVWGACRPASIGTFNIEQYPKHARQDALVFEEIEGLGLDLLAVQELRKPEHFRARARQELGASWALEVVEGRHRLYPGLLYDRARWSVLEVQTRQETVLRPGHRPVLDVLLARRWGFGQLRVFVLHLKAFGGFWEERRAQLRALEPVIAAALRRGEEVVVLGDFNATGGQDRETIAAMVGRLGMRWASRDVECTAYWDRDRRGCEGSRLDHILVSWRSLGAVRSEGACGRVGCAKKESCPVYCEEISDHCPVVLP